MNLWRALFFILSGSHYRKPDKNKTLGMLTQ